MVLSNQSHTQKVLEKAITVFWHRSRTNMKSVTIGWSLHPWQIKFATLFGFNNMQVHIKDHQACTAVTGVMGYAPKRQPNAWEWKKWGGKITPNLEAGGKNLARDVAKKKTKLVLIQVHLIFFALCTSKVNQSPWDKIFFTLFRAWNTVTCMNLIATLMSYLDHLQFARRKTLTKTHTPVLDTHCLLPQQLCSLKLLAAKFWRPSLTW